MSSSSQIIEDKENTVLKGNLWNCNFRGFYFDQTFSSIWEKLVFKMNLGLTVNGWKIHTKYWKSVKIQSRRAAKLLQEMDSRLSIIKSRNEESSIENWWRMNSNRKGENYSCHEKEFTVSSPHVLWYSRVKLLLHYVHRLNFILFTYEPRNQSWTGPVVMKVKRKLWPTQERKVPEVS